MTQTQTVLRHLLNNGTISRGDALSLGVANLTARIADLRKRDCRIFPLGEGVFEFPETLANLCAASGVMGGPEARDGA